MSPACFEHKRSECAIKLVGLLHLKIHTIYTHTDSRDGLTVCLSRCHSDLDAEDQQLTDRGDKGSTPGLCG